MTSSLPTPNSKLPAPPQFESLPPSRYTTAVILPGQTLGIVGGGQLGRMLALSARQMGYRIAVYDPKPDGPAAQVADWQTNADFDDIAAARAFARAVDVVTFEFENVPAETLAAIAEIRPVHPSPRVLATSRHRMVEKDFLNSIGVATAPYRAVNDLPQLHTAIAALGTPAILKTVEFGYDGKGQFKLTDAAQAAEAWAAIGGRPAVLEGFVAFEKEISVVAARGQDGTFRPYPPIENEHRNQILDVSRWPARVSPAAEKTAIDIARAVGEALDIVGVFCVELFVAGDTVIANEIAPRPHNSGHLTIDAMDVSQFDQQLRAVCGLPLHEPRPTCGGAAMANLLGDLWPAGGEPRWEQALADAAVHLHLYGKRDAKPGRKMGHITTTAANAEQASRLAIDARCPSAFWCASESSGRVVVFQFPVQENHRVFADVPARKKFRANPVFRPHRFADANSSNRQFGRRKFRADWRGARPYMNRAKRAKTVRRGYEFSESSRRFDNPIRQPTGFCERARKTSRRRPVRL